MPATLFTLRSTNAKTGAIPVSTSDKSTCPASCPLKNNGCYAEQGNLGMLWSKMTKAGPNSEFKSGVATVKTGDWSKLTRAVKALHPGQLWRHNQAGDLPVKLVKTSRGVAVINASLMTQLVAANAGKKGFTYTHHDMSDPKNQETVRKANAKGFTVNLSANNLDHADKLSDLGIGPVVTILPTTLHGNVKVETPAGRRVVVCPATYRDDVTCKSCGLCAVQERKVIVGFPAHGPAKRKASEVAIH